MKMTHKMTCSIHSGSYEMLPCSCAKFDWFLWALCVVGRLMLSPLLCISTKKKKKTHLCHDNFLFTAI